VLTTLRDDPAPSRRAYAAEALGEFLAKPGIAACARAIEVDQDPNVRAAAARALGRLNDDGRGALSRALGDTDTRVKLSALGSAGRINGFTDAAAVTRLVSDSDGAVRRGAAELLGGMRATDSALALMGIAKNDPDASVRNSACHSLGALHDGRARAVLEDIAANDTDGLVRDQAKIALRRL
jgi:HEAT repeat protein